MTRTVIESKTKTVIIGFDEPFAVIGERINPTGNARLATAGTGDVLAGMVGAHLARGASAAQAATTGRPIWRKR